MNAIMAHPLKVFLCHASGDKPPVRELYKRLTLEGVDAWLDQEKLLPGQDWRVEIPRAVEEADVVLVCLSKKSVTKEGYVQKEIKYALDIAEEKPEGTIFLIPARLEACPVPERLSRWQWVDLYEEDGFLRLLRSLKVRAERVGAVIRPASYEDADREREQRIGQLYTEGLAAFWVEDWDRACQRFRAILSEQPNHAGATEKLEQAERQSNLARLYAQSMDAVRSENWQAAIKTLEELSQKSADYKDVAQLLKNAKRQKQLKGLYAEAKALHAAQQWQAVVKVFEQIHAFDPAYPDPDGLLSSAEKEAAELKRLAQLNELYSQAVRQIDAGQWLDARQKLEQIHKSQIGFLETERLLGKVEKEIQRFEERNRRNEQIGVLYEQAHGFVSTHHWHKALAKLEEIHKLDEQFPDKDGIAEKVKAELAREEQEAQRQSELAAMYAEAVRLLKEAKYQAALEKWNEVQALDPKYRDSAHVKSIAKRELDHLMRPAVAKEKGASAGRISVDWFILLAALGFALARLAQQNLGLLFQADIPGELGWALRGMVDGVITVLILQKVVQEWRWKAVLTFAVCWTVLYLAIFAVILERNSSFLTSLIFSFAPFLSIIVASRWTGPKIEWTIDLLIFAGWILAWTIGPGTAGYLGMSPFKWAISDAIAAGVGLWVTLDLLRGRSRLPVTEFEPVIAFNTIQRPERVLLLALLGTIIIRAIWGLFQNWLHIWDGPSLSVLQFISLFVLGGCYGTVVALSLRRIIPGWNWKHAITVVVGWSLGLSTSILSGRIGLPFIAPVLALSGLSVTGAIKWAKPSLSPLKFTLLFVCWALTWNYGNLLGGYLVATFENDYTWCAADAITILLGLVATYGIYEYSSGKLPKLTLFSTLGFSVSIIVILIVTNPTVHDGFGNLLYNDSYNKSVWRMEVSDSRNSANQQNGAILLTSNGYRSNISLHSREYYSKTLTTPTFIEASFRLEPNQNGGAGISVHMNGRAAFATCQIWGMNGKQEIICQALNFDAAVRDIRAIEIVQGSEHSARIEVDPGVPTFLFYIDGNPVGNYTPASAATYRSTQYFFSFSSGCDGDGCNDHSTSRTVQAYFDYVKIGPIR